MKQSGDHYTPSANKRWEISRDEISRERLEKLKEIHRYFQEKVPDVTIGITLFGSLSKGKELNPQNAANADVDVCAFIDYGEFLENFTKTLNDHPESDFVKYIKEQAETFKELFPTLLSAPNDKINADFLKAKLKEFVQDVFIALLGESQVEDVTGKKADYLEVYPISLQGDDSIMSVVNKLDSGRPKEGDDQLNYWSLNISRFFHLDMGGNMKKYRERFYRELAIKLANGRDEAEYAKSLWRDVVLAMKMAERLSVNLSPELQRKFPSENLEEFLKKQGIQIPQST
ncbi:MAG: hypothetical protein ACD_72C00187G0002 [uncultured bacterium]|nr:MAG: hypothetical protein ACD_72C00187G0002 [uncultured bacterium]